MPPCNDACPAGENVQRWLYDAEPGDYEAAWHQLVEDNPFPAIMGRICYHPCETACNRAQLDEAVGINSVERFLGDLAIERGWALPAAGTDYQQARPRRWLRAPLASAPPTTSVDSDTRSTSSTSAPMLGGMMRYGIPAYRLPRAVLDAEIARVIALGVEVELDHAVNDIEHERSEGGFDAAFPRRRRAARAASRHPRRGLRTHPRRGIAFAPSCRGRPTACSAAASPIYGGGDTALDAARTARRLGATDAVDRLPPQPRAHASPWRRARRGHRRGDDDALAVDGHRVDGDHLVLEKMRLNDDGIPRTDRRTRRARRRLARTRARSGH